MFFCNAHCYYDIPRSVTDDDVFANGAFGITVVVGITDVVRLFKMVFEIAGAFTGVGVGVVLVSVLVVDVGVDPDLPLK